VLAGLLPPVSALWVQFRNVSLPTVSWIVPTGPQWAFEISTKAQSGGTTRIPAISRRAAGPFRCDARCIAFA